MCAFVSCHGARHSGFQLRSPHCWTDVKQRMLSTANKTFTCRTRWMITGFAVHIQEFSDQCHRQMYSPQDQNRPPQPAMDGYYTQAITTEKKKKTSYSSPENQQLVCLLIPPERMLAQDETSWTRLHQHHDRRWIEEQQEALLALHQGQKSGQHQRGAIEGERAPVQWQQEQSAYPHQPIQVSFHHWYRQHYTTCQPENRC